MPAFARDVLHENSVGLGLLMGSVGVGALGGAYALSRLHERHLTLAPILAAGGFGLGLILFSQSHSLYLSIALILPTSFCMMLLGGTTNTIIQTVADDHFRGRVVSLYAMSFMGMMPWGALLLGTLATHIGIGEAITAGGSVCILAAIAAWFDNSRRVKVLRAVPGE
jgi:MFS family permease